MSIITRAYRNCTELLSGLQVRSLLRVPSVCRLCSQWCPDVVCRSCIQNHLHLQTRCPLCALPCKTNLCNTNLCNTNLCDTCLLHPPVWQQAVAVLGYATPWRELIIEYKFQHNAGLQRLWTQLIKEHPLAKPLIDSADVLVPVPLSAQRLRERGFNQAQWLALHLCRQRTKDHLLWRIRHTAAQTGLDRQARMHNLRHAVVVNPSASAQVAQKNILLVDDVMTTGSTLSACAQALLAAGADKVHCLVLARAAPHETGF